MKESVELTANSLILTGLTFRSFTVVVSDCVLPFAVQEAFATKSPLKAVGPDMILYVILRLAPGESVPPLSADAASAAVHVHCLGREMFNFSPVTGVSVVFLNVREADCDDPGEKVRSRRGVAVANAD